MYRIAGLNGSKNHGSQSDVVGSNIGQDFWPTAILAVLTPSELLHNPQCQTVHDVCQLGIADCAESRVVGITGLALC